ncbi:MAG TPA: hypothetical protein VIO62_05795 [Candidatus Dormibacteraeota bacterium]|jgi:hypothetical protein
MIKFPIAALVVFVALLGGFYGGYKVGGGGASAAAPASATGGGAAAFARGVATACPSPNATATPAASGRAVARRGTSGTVTNLTSSSLTVHDARCNTDVKVTFDPSVIIRKTATGQVSDLQESETVTVVGTRQADGSVKANSIQIVPAGGAGGGGFGAGAANGG